MAMNIGIRRDSVGVSFVSRGLWEVHVAGHRMHDQVWAVIVCAQFTTRKLANAYAKNLRKALRPG